MKQFYGGLRKASGSGVTDVIEKDYHLHRLLHRISLNPILRESLVFKGGTCLVKAYTGYYRFSEDIDFTRRQDEPWRLATKGRPGKVCSAEISKYLKEFREIARDLGLGFEGDKSKDLAHEGDVNVRGGGRMTDFWLRYRSEVLEVPVRIKIQINLDDLIEFPIQDLPLRSYVDGLDLEDLRLQYKEPCDEYCRRIILPCYDSREIFAEKCRAAMTRKVYKPRDILDIRVMERELGYSVDQYREHIVRKTKYMLKYSKYRENLQKMEFPDEHALTATEEKLLLRKIPGDFPAEAVRIHRQLMSLRDEILPEAT